MSRIWHGPYRGFLLAVALLACVWPAAQARRIRFSSGTGGQGLTLRNDSAQVWKDVRAWQEQYQQYAIVVTVRTDENEGRPLMPDVTANVAGLPLFPALAAWVFMSHDAVSGVFTDLPATASIVLVDPQGRQVATAPFDLAALDSPAHLAAAWQTLLDAGEKPWLGIIEQAARTTLGAEKTKAVATALGALDAETAKDRRAARTFLQEQLPAAAPLLWRARLTSTSVEVRESCRDLLTGWIRRSNARWLGLDVPAGGSPEILIME